MLRCSVYFGSDMITCNSDLHTFKLDTDRTSYIFGIEDKGSYLVHYYYGRKISDADISYVADKAIAPSEFPKDKINYLDCKPFEFPTGGLGDFRSHALEIENADGSCSMEFSFKSYEIYKGKKQIPGLPATFGTDGVESLDIVLEDPILQLRVILHYSVFADCDAITRSVTVTNINNEPVYITKIASTSVDIPNKNYSLMTHSGSWSREHHIDLRKLSYGYQGTESIRGISSAQAHPFMALTSENVTQTEGEVYGVNFVYSGCFDANVFLDQFDMARLTMGISPYHFKWKLEKEESFDSPEAVMIYSAEGLGNMTRSFHKLYRNHLIRSPYKNKKRPILINNWEATYFDFNTDKLLAIAKQASELGIEMLVMDDGWFGGRNDDNSSLGDWYVNEQKLPGGLKRLVDGVNAYGLKFGIWMEPEMVCPDSDLYRAHPDWAVQVPGRTPGYARNQLVLDITRDEVWNYVWNAIESTLKSANIEYLKWDMNRPLTDLYSAGLPADRQGEFLHRYMLAVYRLQETLITTFPNLLLENCSSGGGRYDAGMLYYSPQVWSSDDTDAVERLKIQEGTAMIYPLGSMGAHVSDCPNHGLGRTTPFKTRGHVALAGTFGYELDVTRIPEEDRNMIPEQVKMYHKYNDLVREGEYYRLASYSENKLYDAWMVKAQDESEILITYVNVTRLINVKDRFLFLQGLDPKRKYRNEETGRIYSGDTLMFVGLPVDHMWGDYCSKLIHLTEVK